MLSELRHGELRMGCHLPDELLARRAAGGRLEDFEELLRRYRTRVYRICLRMAGNSEDAEDWAQECFVRVYGQLARYDARQLFAPWLMRVVTNTCINLAKARNVRQGRLELGLDEDRGLAATTPDPLHVALHTDEARQIQAAVAQLEPHLQQAVALRVLEGLSFHELAETLGVPLQTAASRVRRALNQVRQRLERTESEVER
jgi:RNA polymerase sigma-70 factor, ECF subfamily